MKLRIAWSAVIAAALAACGPAPSGKQDEFPVVEAPVADYSIGPEGAAGVSTALPMTREAVAAAAPAYIVAEVEDQVEGQAFRAITLSAGDEEVFRLLPTADGARVHSIVTASTQARGPNAEIVGQSKFGQAPATQVMFCGSEQVEGQAGFACSDIEAGRFWRVYKLPAGYGGPTEPFDAIDPDFALDATLSEMRWIAP